LHELGVLKHVSYVLEAFASEATRDGKRELTRLIDHVRSDEALPSDCRNELLRRLTEVQRVIQHDDLRGAMIDLSGAVGYMWGRVHPGWLPYDK
jgi:hypothetical protein